MLLKVVSLIALAVAAVPPTAPAARAIRYYICIPDTPAECHCAWHVSHSEHDLSLSCEVLGLQLPCLDFTFEENPIGLNQHGDCVQDPPDGEPDTRICKGWTQTGCGFHNWDVTVEFTDWIDCDEPTTCCGSDMTIYKPGGGTESLPLGEKKTITILVQPMDCGAAQRDYDVQVKCGTVLRGLGRLTTKCDQCPAKS